MFRQYGKIVLEKLARGFPDGFYFCLMRFLYCLGNSERRGSSVFFKRIKKGLYQVSQELPDGRELYFHERSRFHRYLFPAGPAKCIAEMRKKYRVNRDVMCQSGVIVDVGANIGEFSLAVADFAALVLAVDPDTSVQEALSRNLEGFANTLVMPVALSNRNGTQHFYFATREADSSFIRPPGYSHVKKMPTITLDKLIHDLNVKFVDFLKIEAEGWEPEVLEGAKDTLGLTLRVSIDAGPERNGASTAGTVANYLESIGFSVERQGDMVFGYNIKLRKMSNRRALFG